MRDLLSWAIWYDELFVTIRLFDIAKTHVGELIGQCAIQTDITILQLEESKGDFALLRSESELGN